MNVTDCIYMTKDLNFIYNLILIVRQNEMKNVCSRKKLLKRTLQLKRAKILRSLRVYMSKKAYNTYLVNILR